MGMVGYVKVSGSISKKLSRPGALILGKLKHSFILFPNLLGYYLLFTAIYYFHIIIFSNFHSRDRQYSPLLVIVHFA